MKKEVTVSSVSLNVQYSQRHTIINHCDRRITHLGDWDIHYIVSFNKYIFKISFTFRVLLTIIQKAYQNRYVD